MDNYTQLEKLGGDVEQKESAYEAINDTFRHAAFLDAKKWREYFEMLMRIVDSRKDKRRNDIRI